MKEFHIWDFPDNVYIKLEENYRRKLFERLYKRFRTIRKAARELSISPRHMRKYDLGYSITRGKIYPQLIPLHFIRKLFLFENIYEIEENISILSISSGLNVYNPKLPIKESPELYSFIGHMIADGCASGHHVPYYANSDVTLRMSFVRLLTIFGDFQFKEKTTNTTRIIEFPKVITDIIQYIFDFPITHPNRIPNFLFSASDKCKAAFLGALFDDDGSFSTSIVLTIHSTNLMQQVKKLLESLNIKTTKLSIYKYGYKKDKISFNIKTKSICRFYDIVPITCPKKKRSLEYKIRVRNRVNRTRDPILIRKEIISLLSKRSHKTIEIANKLLFTIGGIYPHLDLLLAEGIIRKNGFKNKVVWELN